MSRSVRWGLVLGTLLLFWCVGNATQAGGGLPMRRDRFKEIKEDYDRQFAEFVAASRKATTMEQQDAAEKCRPSLNMFGKRFLELAKQQPADEAACDALLWIASNYGRREEMKLDEALDLLEKHHLGTPKFKNVVDALAYANSKRANALAETLMEKAGDREVRGLACLFLAYGARARLGDENPEGMARVEALMGRIKKDFADVRFEKRLLGEMADAQLFEFRNLIPGKVVPELEGVDVTGKKMKLSDYRGKVVALVFWGSWCGPCMGEVPHLRELATKYAGRPFTIVGVNSGDTRDKAEKTMRDHKMTWPIFFDGEDGPIIRKWNVVSFPTIYLIDAAGVIRAKDGSEDLDEAIAGLVRGAKRN